MITDRRRLGERAGAALIRRVAAAARAGMHLIQIRERDMSDGELLTLVMQAVEAVRGTRARMLVNEDAMHEFHRRHSIEAHTGKGRRDKSGRDYIRWCFANGR